jgi:hypothetical protein
VVDEKFHQLLVEPNLLIMVCACDKSIGKIVENKLQHDQQI